MPQHLVKGPVMDKVPEPRHRQLPQLQRHQQELQPQVLELNRVPVPGRPKILLITLRLLAKNLSNNMMNLFQDKPELLGVGTRVLNHQ